MNQRAQYLIQVLEKIGSPLLAGLIKSADEKNAADEAQKIAVLLSASVKCGIDIGNMIDINKAGPDGDKLRIALTALASPLVAGYYARHGKAPDDTQSDKLNKALQAVLTFSDNFTDDEESTEALAKISVQSLQKNIQYIDAILPVVNAVSRFAFGQSEVKFLQDITQKLTSSATALRGNLLGDSLSPDEQKTAELALVKSLAELYADAHESEVDKLMAMDETKRAEANISVDTVWGVYEIKAAMIEALAANLVPGETSSAPTPAAPSPIQEKQENLLSSTSPTTAPKEETPPPATPPAPEKPPVSSTPANPMAMFAKKPATESKPEENAEQTPPPTAPEPPPAAEAPAETSPPLPEKETPPPPPAEPEQPEEKPSAPPTGNPQGNPMSFFKKKDEGEDE